MKKSVKWIFTVLTVLMMAFIFVMSSHTAPESAGESRAIGRIIGRIIERGFDELSPEEQLVYIEGIDGTVRRFGHFTEFAVLGVLLHLSLSSWGVKKKIALPASFGAGVLYALSDEVHQLFIEGRSMEFSDVLIDSAGVAFGCIIALIVLTAVVNRRTKKGEAEYSASGK